MGRLVSLVLMLVRLFRVLFVPPECKTSLTSVPDRKHMRHSSSAVDRNKGFNLPDITKIIIHDDDSRRNSRGTMILYFY